MEIKQKKSNIGSFVVYFTLFAVLLFFNGFMNLVAAEFDASILLDGTYWLKTVSGSGSGLASFVIFAMMRRDALIISEPMFNEDLLELNKITKENVGPDFTEFIAEKNLQSKIFRWKEKQNQKLVKWNTRISSRTLSYIQRVEQEKKISYFKRKKALRWMNRKARIMERISPEWINENIQYQKIKYPQTTPGEIINGVRNENNDKIIDNSVFDKIMRDKAPMLFITIILQALYHSLSINPATTGTVILMGIAVQLITIFTNVGFGLNYGKVLFGKLDKNNLTTRKQYIMEYLIWKKK